MVLLYCIQYRAFSDTPINMQSRNRFFVDLVGSKRPTTHGAMGFESLSQLGNITPQLFL
jgi:hypothetical protein